MRTINTFIPSDLVDSLKKFADKTQKNVEGFAYSVGKPYPSFVVDKVAVLYVTRLMYDVYHVALKEFL